MLEWLIIGGGIQGCTMASYLIKNKKVHPMDMAIIDPHPMPLHMWLRCTSVIEMPYLRSPSIHHLDPEPFALEKFSKENGYKKQDMFHVPYDRPSLSLFNEHCDHLFNEIDIEKSWLQGRVISLNKVSNGWQVILEQGQTIDSKNVVIAIGLGEQPFWPDWALKAKEEGVRIIHIFEDENVDLLSVDKPVLIVGGGITAAHTAIKWSNIMPGKVTLLTRHNLRVHQFDSNPGWLGPKLMRDFQKISCYVERRKVIRASRYRGSMPAELKTKLLKTQSDGKLHIIVDEIQNTKFSKNEIQLELKERNIKTDQVILSTGFEQSVPGMSWLINTISTHQLRCATCGYPIVQSSLQWEQGLFVLGALAELEVGPVARNISGARRGSERIIQSI